MTVEQEIRALEQLPELRAWRGRRARWAYTPAALARRRRALNPKS